MSVFNIYQELGALITALNSEGIDYALCGGLALAIHAEPRATKDIDLLVKPDDLDRIRTVLRGLGFRLEAAPMEFKSGISLQRISKIEQHEVFTLDLVLATEAFEGVWTSRQRVTWNEQPLWVVSREGLIAMKRLAGRPQDLADLHHLGAEDD